MAAKLAAAVLIGLMATTGALAGQAAPPGPSPLAVGVPAPDFTLGGATKAGVLGEAIRLSALKGQTVVLAFYPRARTRGCTVQMEAYRDQYSTLFNGGDGVKVFAVSVDADTTLASWAQEREYPVTFLSDVGGAVSRAYGVLLTRGDVMFSHRTLYVIDRNGVIARVISPFRETDPTAYTELAAAVDAAAEAR
ncbi:MAG: peroxiredoxin family protein [Gemmatimonadales bacterium]